MSIAPVDRVKLEMYVNEQMSLNQIAQRLGTSVSGLKLEAAAAGIKLTPGVEGDSPTAETGNPAVGKNVNTTV